MNFREAATQSVCALGLLLLMPSLSPAQSTSPSTQAADNTAVNVRDKQSDLPKSTDQPNNKADIQLAASVRRAIINDRSLSTSAHNVKLVAISGVVTLRGPVSTAQERTRIGDIASKVTGVSQVDNQLDITQH